MITIILAAVAALIVVLVLFIASCPADFRITRGARMEAAPEEVFAQVNDLRRFQEWSPWAKLDPEVVTTYDGPRDGVGCSFHWHGNNQVGQGIMTIIESYPHELIRMRLDFLKPFKATNTAKFTFAPEDGGTTVTWSMSGRRNFFCKAVGLFLNCDKMVGGQFEQGLENLRAIVEGRESVPPPPRGDGRTIELIPTPSLS